MNTNNPIYKLLLFASLLFIASCGKNVDEPIHQSFRLEKIAIDGVENASIYPDISPTPVISLTFSDAVDTKTIQSNIILRKETNDNISLKFKIQSNVIVVEPEKELTPYTSYELIVNTGLKSASGISIETGKVYSITTGINSTDKFPRISDDELLTLVQKQTFNYFWNFAHPTSGMARERTTSTNTVTTGGTGFGVMAMIVAVEREFITRNEAFERIQKITTFLTTKCTRYHGAFAHWINGETGATVAFSTYDNGADLVETSLLFQGLLTAREYFDKTTPEETQLRESITQLWEEIDWTWFQKESENVLYWHWSPQYNWQMNLKISGWNECLITYVLAASSPTHSISKNVYTQGWARNGAMANGKSFYSYTLPLGSDYGGPLFLSQYSFLGLNPKGLKDQYADYWEQNRNHTLINRQYCIENPKKFSGYGQDCWGLTASDGNDGYSAYSPTNDKGVIAPTAALSAMPYTPQESMQALHFFYYKLGDKLWSEYGFVDAFNLSRNWFDNQHIAINQGPIIVMIENYRTGLLWKLLMKSPEIRVGLTKLGFTYPENP